MDQFKRRLQAVNLHKADDAAEHFFSIPVLQRTHNIQARFAIFVIHFPHSQSVIRFSIGIESLPPADAPDKRLNVFLRGKQIFQVGANLFPIFHLE